MPPGTILLIDDVMTTGSTLNVAARTLKASGAERVSAWVLCHSVIGNDSRDLIQLSFKTEDYGMLDSCHLILTRLSFVNFNSFLKPSPKQDFPYDSQS